jgi:glycosyltransferase involved in cell wall biosynthesis
MKRNPLFSIIVTTHCRPEMLTRALASIRALGSDDIEIIVVSDDDDRNTYLVAQDFLGCDDTFIKRSGRPGPARSRNVGIALAVGQYVLFLDDDDAYAPHLLRSLVAQGLNGTKAIYWDYRLGTYKPVGDGSFEESTETRALAGISQGTLYVTNFIPINCIAVPRLFARTCRFDENLRSHEDWDFILALLASEIELVHIPVIGSTVYQHTQLSQRNTSSLAAGDWPPDFMYIYRKWPVIDEIKQVRLARLAAMGVTAPIEWL